MSGDRPAAERAETLEIDPRLPITAQVYAYLKRSILTLAFRPSEGLSEKEIALRLGISRTPVREALIRLADEGLVDVMPQRGTFVAPIRLAEVMEAQFIREALEVAVVRRVAEHASPDLVERLHASLRRQEAAIGAHDHELFLRLDEELHRMLCDAVMLPRAWKVVQNVKGQLDRVRYLSLPEPGHLDLLQVQHAGIVAAIAKGDAALAADKMRLHLQEVFGSVRLLMRDSPGLFV